ncbi:N-acetyltransferase family protein [Pseudalkalibacillus sp. SCS-8]|uniref:GNAT family N-acetyltransferase n=1 Tax=Pseudalkalibacillus nanhaiensis TaxID=3115291 RepID=UPI0032DB5155
MKVRIRNANEGDLIAILEIYNEVVRTSPVTFDTSEQTLIERKKWFDQFDEHDPLLVAENDGEILGYACLTRFRPKPAYAFTGEDSIYIKKKARGNGIGSMLLAKLIRHAKDYNYHSIVAVIANDDPSSVKLHKKHGFEKTGTIYEAGFKFEKWHDIHFYQLKLDADG